jgi:hypothetical protein
VPNTVNVPWEQEMQNSGPYMVKEKFTVLGFF